MSQVLVMDYTYLFCKIILNLGRIFGVTFGGLKLKKTFVKTKRFRKFTFKTNSFLKVLSYFSIFLSIIFMIALAIHFYSSENLSRMTTINQLLLISSDLIFITYTVSFCCIAQRYGKKIFTFILNYRINFKQFLILIGILIWAILSFCSIIASDLVYLFYEQEFEKNLTNFLEIEKISTDVSEMEKN